MPHEQSTKKHPKNKKPAKQPTKRVAGAEKFARVRSPSMSSPLVAPLSQTACVADSLFLGGA